MQHVAFNSLKTDSKLDRSQTLQAISFLHDPFIMKPPENYKIYRIQILADGIDQIVTELKMAESSESQFGSQVYWREPLPILSVVMFQYPNFFFKF